MSEHTSYISERPALANRFKIIDTLGEGASSSVYLVSDSKRNGQHVALKVLVSDDAFDEHTLRRFTEEMEICRELSHPNLVEAYDLIDLGDTVAFTMEYVRGVDLLEIFRQKDRLSYEELDRIFIDILEALSLLHEKDVVHRDLKLENILIREDGTVKLSDLGLMKRLDREGLTKPGLLLGTVHYMPPEYITGGEYDRRGDIYGVTIMLLELVTKKRRLSSLSGREVIQELIRTKFQIPETLLSELPRKYQSIIRRGAAVDPDARYRSVGEMIGDFKREFSEFIGRETAEMNPQMDLGSTHSRLGRALKGRRGKNQKIMKWALILLCGAAAATVAAVAAFQGMP